MNTLQRSGISAWPARLTLAIVGLLFSTSAILAQVLGDPDAPHTYTFIDDFAAGLVTLAEREEALGQVWHVPSAETISTRQFIEMVFREVGTPMRLQAPPKLAITLLAIVNPFMRAAKETLYQSERPFVMDHSKYARTFGSSPTPHRQAITETLEWFRQHSSGGHER